MYDENFFLYYSDFDLCRRILKSKKTIIQIFEAKAQHDHGEIKVKNALKRIFIRNYNFTFDELYYFFKINQHYEKYKNLKKKLLNYIIKLIINLFLLRLTKSVYYFSKVAAFYKFNKFLNKNFDTIKNIKLPKTIETILIIKPIKNPKKNPEANNNISPPGNEKLK